MDTSFLQQMVLALVISLNLRRSAAGSFCDEDIYLRAGHEGVVPCDFGDFSILGWLNPDTDLESAVPFIYLEGSEIHGPESKNGKYSMFLNGSLVIKNVTLNHEKNYTVRIVKNSAVSHYDVSVKVYVLPVPEYPLVNMLTDQERVVVDSPNGRVSFYCTMDHIRPAAPLQLVFVSPISNGMSVKTIPYTLDNHDGTYNVSLDIQLMGINLPSGIYSLECRAAESFGHLFTSVSAIELVVFGGRYKFPSVNGGDSQQHVVLDVDREGVLNCSMDRVPPDLILEWDLIQHDSPAEIAIDGQSHFSHDNGDGTYNISLISRFKTTSNSVQRLNLKCMVSGKDAELYPLDTIVELNFPAAGRGYNFPSVNGLDSQQHVVLDVDREGVLNCSMDRVPPGSILIWDLIQQDSPAEIVLERQSHFSDDNGDGTYDISLSSSYRTTSNSVQHLSLKCTVFGDAADLYPLYATVELNFPSADGHYYFPAVNGLEPQQHVVLDVNREGTLNCSMDRASQNIELEWNYVNHFSLDKIALQSQGHSSFDNGDGTYNVTSFARYKTTNDSIQCVTLKCQISGETADFYPLFTTVELRFPEVPSSDNPSGISILLIVNVAVCMMILLVLYVYLLRWSVHRRIAKSCQGEKVVSGRGHMNQELELVKGPTSTDTLIQS